MRARTASAALLVAATLVVAPVSSALADTSTDAHPGVTKSAVAKARAEARRLEAKAKSKRFFVLGGKVTGVAGQELSFTVHGGRFKPLRGQTVTVTVAPDAKVTRDGVVTLAEVQVGDHVVVKSRDFDFTVATADATTATVTPTVTVTATVSRVAASPADTDEVVTTTPAG